MYINATSIYIYKSIYKYIYIFIYIYICIGFPGSSAG